MVEYFSANLWQLWSLITIICLILELTNGDFFIMCFAIGGVCAAIASAFGLGFYGGLIVFALFSVLSIFFVRPLALNYLHRNEDSRISNADAIIGREGRVSEDIIAGEYGRVAIDGDDWKAEAVDGLTVAKGEKVRVVGRDSLIIKVERV